MNLNSPQPILDQIPSQLTNVDLRTTGQNTSLYVVIGVLSCVLLVLVGLYGAKLVIGAPKLNKLISTHVVPTGYFRANQSLYINVSNRLFENHPTNFAVTLSLDDQPRTVWIKEYLTESRDVYVLKTEIQGLMFSLQTGPPGAGAPWRIAFLAPILRSVNKNVVLTSNKSSVWAVSPAWPGNLIYLTFRPEGGNLYWTSSPGDQLSHIHLVQN